MIIIFFGQNLFTNALHLEINIYIFAEMLQCVVFSQLSVCFSAEAVIMWPSPMMPWPLLYTPPGLQPAPLKDIKHYSIPRHHLAHLVTYYWHIAADTGDQFELIHLRTPPPQQWPLAVATEARLVCKRAVPSLVRLMFCAVSADWIRAKCRNFWFTMKSSWIVCNWM